MALFLQELVPKYKYLCLFFGLRKIKKPLEKCLGAQKNSRPSCRSCAKCSLMTSHPSLCECSSLLQFIKVPNYPRSSSLGQSASPTAPHLGDLAPRSGWGKKPLSPLAKPRCSPWSIWSNQNDWDMVIPDHHSYQLFPSRHNVLFNRLLCFTLTLIFHQAWQNFKAKNPVLHSKETKLDSKLPFFDFDISINCSGKLLNIFNYITGWQHFLTSKKNQA